MGPRSDERGNRSNPDEHAHRFMAFNGAALRRARKLGGSRGTGAGTTTSMGPRSDERGNLNTSRTFMTACTPSMGPRSDERGNPALRRASEKRVRAFNGAALRRARKHRVAYRISRNTRPFN